MRLLEDRMASFSQRLSDLFGGQISGLNELNQQTALGVQHAVSSLHTLVARLEESGMRSSSAMAERMAASIQAMEERQAAINSQTQSFVEQIRALVGASQEETQHKLQLTLESIRQQMTSIVSSLGDSQQQALEGTRARETALADRSQVLIGTLTGTVEDVVKELRLLSQSMADSVSLLSAVTSTSVSGMQTGADRIGTAAAAFAAAGDRVNLVLERSADVSAKLSEVSGSLRSSAISVQDALQDYRSQREFIAQMLSGVRDTVELAKKEASLTGDILRRIEQATSKLEIAQKAADEYLDSVNQVLAKSSDAFRQAVVTTLDRVNHDFHVKLRDAVGLLATTIQELETALSALSSAPPQR